MSLCSVLSLILSKFLFLLLTVLLAFLWLLLILHPSLHLTPFRFLLVLRCLLTLLWFCLLYCSSVILVLLRYLLILNLLILLVLQLLLFIHLFFGSPTLSSSVSIVLTSCSSSVSLLVSVSPSVLHLASCVFFLSYTLKMAKKRSTDIEKQAELLLLRNNIAKDIFRQYSTIRKHYGLLNYMKRYPKK